MKLTSSLDARASKDNSSLFEDSANISAQEIAGEWIKQSTIKRRELDEFELLEQQAEVLANVSIDRKASIFSKSNSPNRVNSLPEQSPSISEMYDNVASYFGDSNSNSNSLQNNYTKSGQFNDIKYERPKIPSNISYSENGESSPTYSMDSSKRWGAVTRPSYDTNKEDENDNDNESDGDAYLDHQVDRSSRENRLDTNQSQNHAMKQDRFDGEIHNKSVLVDHVIEESFNPTSVNLASSYSYGASYRNSNDHLKHKGDHSSIEFQEGVSGKHISGESPTENYGFINGIVRSRPKLSFVTEAKIVKRPSSASRTRLSSTSTGVSMNSGAATKMSGDGLSRNSSTVCSSASVGKFNSDSHDKSHSDYSEKEDLSSVLHVKAKELEDELQTYRSENAQLKLMRKQQEASLAEALNQKSEVFRWITEEKLKTEKLCEEQRQLAAKDRRTAGKILREARENAAGSTQGSSGNSSIRKERQEIEALTATLEKMKVDNDLSSKKYRLNEKRLQDIIRGHSTTIESLEAKILSLESQKLVLWEFLDNSGLKIPSSLRSSRFTSMDTNSENRMASSRTPVRKSTSMGTGTLSSTGKLSSRHSGRKSDFAYAEEVEVEPENVYTSTRVALDSSTNRYSRNLSFPDNTRKNNNYNNLDDDLRVDDTKSDIDVAASWARSSRSSRASRYSSHSDDGGDEDFVDGYNEPGNLDANNYTDSSNQMTKSFSITTTHDHENLQFMKTTGKNSGSISGHSEGLISRNQTSGDHLFAQTASALTSRFNGLATNNYGDSIVRNSRENIVSGAPLEGTGIPSHTALGPPEIATIAASSSSSRSEEIRFDGTKIVRYRNGTIKEVYPDGRSVVIFTNGDTKSTDPLSGLVIYYYAEAKTTHTTFPDGLQVYEFPNEQVEKHFVSGRKEIKFPDGTVKIIHTDGVQESHFPDGVAIREYPNGRREEIQN